MIVFILCTLSAIAVSTYFYGLTNLKYVKNHWSELRCDPRYMGLAGYVGDDFTQNVSKCMNKSFSDYLGASMDPLHGQMSLVSDSIESIGGSLDEMRGLLGNVRGGFGMVFQMVFGKIHNLMSSMQYLMIRIRTLMGRVVGVFASLIYAFYGGLETAQAIDNGPPGRIIRAL